MGTEVFSADAFRAVVSGGENVFFSGGNDAAAAPLTSWLERDCVASSCILRVASLDAGSLSFPFPCALWLSTFTQHSMGSGG